MYANALNAYRTAKNCIMESCFLFKGFGPKILKVVVIDQGKDIKIDLPYITFLKWIIYKSILMRTDKNKSNQDSIILFPFIKKNVLFS